MKTIAPKPDCNNIDSEISLSLEILRAVEWGSPVALEIALAKRNALTKPEDTLRGQRILGVIYL